MGKDIIALMLQEYERFTRAERKIADYVLEHQEETQYISITDLSSQCGVAVSTVSLFCRKLKLAGFNDFKLELARAALPAGPEVSQSGGEITREDSPGQVMGKVLHTAQEALNNAYHMLSETALERAVDLIQGAGQVVCLGQGNHAVVALAAWAQFSTTSPKFKTIQDSHMQTVMLSTLSPEDAVLYFSYSGATHEVLEAAEVIRNRGAKLILVTATSTPPPAPTPTPCCCAAPANNPFSSAPPLPSWPSSMWWRPFSASSSAETRRRRSAAAGLWARR